MKHKAIKSKVTIQNEMNERKEKNTQNRNKKIAGVPNKTPIQSRKQLAKEWLLIFSFQLNY